MIGIPVVSEVKGCNRQTDRQILKILVFEGEMYWTMCTIGQGSFFGFSLT